MPNYEVTKNDAIERFNEISVRALEKGQGTENQFSLRHFRLALLDFKEI